MDIPPEVLPYIIFWTTVGVIGCFISIIIKDKEL
jgi:hypothetical protein